MIDLFWREGIICGWLLLDGSAEDVVDKEEEELVVEEPRRTTDEEPVE